jgi:hypothetical protein
LAAGENERKVTMKSYVKSFVKTACALLFMLGLTMLAAGCPPIKL